MLWGRACPCAAPKVRIQNTLCLVDRSSAFLATASTDELGGNALVLRTERLAEMRLKAVTPWPCPSGMH